jgi:hypothetical protein
MSDNDASVVAKIIADHLRERRDEVLAALGGEPYGWFHDCTSSWDSERAPGDCGYDWCRRSLNSGRTWAFPMEGAGDE